MPIQEPIEETKEDIVEAPKTRPIRKWKLPVPDSPENPSKELKIEKRSETTIVAKIIDVEEIKKQTFAVKRDFDKVQLGLRIVRKNMVHLMAKIDEKLKNLSEDGRLSF